MTEPKITVDDWTGPVYEPGPLVEWREGDPLPFLRQGHVSLVPVELDLSEPTVVTYGDREEDPDTLRALAVRYGQIVRIVPMRRARFETWRDATGQKMGRKTWVAATPRVEVVPDI